MGWTTLYIVGRGDFKSEISRALERSDLKVMSGYITQGREMSYHALYWIDDKTDLRSVKKAIGSKLVWSYRLRFYYSWEHLVEAGEVAGTSYDLEPHPLEK